MPNPVIISQRQQEEKEEARGLVHKMTFSSRSTKKDKHAKSITTTSGRTRIAKSASPISIGKMKLKKVFTSRDLVLFGSSLIIIVSLGLISFFEVASSSSIERQRQSSSFTDSSSSSSSSSAYQNGGRQQAASRVNFDPSNYKSIQEAIQAHPDLREFSKLCQESGVKEIISMDKTQLTVFAPIDKSLRDLLEKSNSRQINLIELAKHHIAQGLIMPDENTKFPLQFFTFSQLSPLYLNQASPTSASFGQDAALFVNNAKILSTHLISIDNDNYQTLHIIDQVVEFAYIKQQRSPPKALPNSAQSGSIMLGSSSSPSFKRATLKRAFNLDELAAQPEAALEFYDRFGDIQAHQPQVDLFHARAHKGTAQQQQQRITLARQDLQSLEKLLQYARSAAPRLSGKLYQVNESSSVNTFFLPISSEELDTLMDGEHSFEFAAALEAHIIPNQALFIRQMGPLGHTHPTLISSQVIPNYQIDVSLNLAKTMPDQHLLNGGAPITASENSHELSEIQFDSSNDDLGSKYLATPLLLQAKCSRREVGDGWSSGAFRPGITSAEILLANIPLTNGVLHLIRRPILITEVNVLDYLNDNDNQLSNVVNAAGSSTTTTTTNDAKQPEATPVKVNRFRELLARERQMLHTFSNEPTMNKTIFVPSDEAFGRLRFDLRALVQGDESLIPKHWDSSYRHDLLERLVKRHIVLHQTLTSEQIIRSAEHPQQQQQQQQQQVLTDNGKLLSFNVLQPNRELQMESDGTRARFLHHDLIGTNGVLHIIDRVLGEEQETVNSLLRSNMVKFNHTLWEETKSNDLNELNELIQSNLKAARGQSEGSMISNSVSNSPPLNRAEHESKQAQSAELSSISKSIGLYLNELLVSNRRQLQLLGSSVNISYQLARLTSLAEGLDDWNDKFKSSKGQFTYFVPSDLAWIKLQQAQPELYKPLMHFLDNKQEDESGVGNNGADSTGAEVGASVGAQQQQPPSSLKSPRLSESSHRLRQILERHLVGNRKISKKELNQLDSIQTSGATLRLVDSQQPVTALEPQVATSNNNMFAAALHSIVSVGGSTGNVHQYQQQQQQQQQLKLKSLSLDSSSANIVQANEASNGWLYIIDNVLLLPNDAEHIVMTSAAPAISSTMSSLLGAHNSAILDFIHSLFAPAPINMSTGSILTLIVTLTVAIGLLLLLALVLITRRRHQIKLNRQQDLDSGLTSSSSANSSSTSTAKSL